MARAINSRGNSSGSGTGSGTDDTERTNRRGDSSATNSDSGNEETEEVSLQSSVEVDEQEETSSAVQGDVILEAIDLVEEAPRKRRGRPRKLTTGESDVPSPTQNKRAAFYIGVLRDTWMDVHNFAGSLIDEELKWTQEESARFAEAAYEVCRARNWLRFLERMTEARLIVIVLSIETEKVQKVLAKQKPATDQTQQLPPPMIRRSGGNTQDQPVAPLQNNGGNPSYVPAPRFIPQQ